MKKLVYIVFVLLFSLISGIETYAQTRKIDSLRTLLNADRPDTSKVIHLNKLSSLYMGIGNYDTALIISNKALVLAKQLDSRKGIANAYNSIGNVYYGLGNYPQALKNYFESLKLREALGNKVDIAYSYNNIGNVYSDQGNYTETLKNYYASLKLSEAIGNKDGVAISLNNIGSVHRSQGNYPEALKKYRTALKIREELNDQLGLASSYNNIGAIYFHQGNYPETLKNYFESLKLREAIGDKQGIATCYNNIGSVYLYQGNSAYELGDEKEANRKYEEALKSYIASLKLKRAIGNKTAIATTANNIGTLYLNINQAKKGRDYILEGLALAKETGSIEDIQAGCAGLAQADSALGNFKDALKYYKLSIIYRDSLFNEENTKKMVEQQMQYEFDKKEAIAKADQDKKDAIALEGKQKQRIVLFFVIGGLLLVVVFSIFLYNRFKITQRQKLIIEKQKHEVDEAYEKLHEKNKEVMDSIMYARRIQRALLTPEKYIGRELNKLMKKK